MDEIDVVLNLCDEDDVAPPVDVVSAKPATTGNNNPAPEITEKAEAVLDDIVTQQTVEEVKEPVSVPEQIPVSTQETKSSVAEVSRAAVVSEEVFKQLSEQIDKLLAKNADIEDQLLKLNGKQVQLNQKLDDANKAASAHAVMQKRMGDELDKYKKNLYASITEPFINQLITIHLDLVKGLKEWESDRAGISADDVNEIAKLDAVIGELKFYTESVEGSLSNCGVEVFTPETDTPMDQLRHVIVKTIPTDDASKHGYIESVRTCGYAYNNKTLRPAKVVVYKAK